MFHIDDVQRSRRIISIGDLHGDFEQATNILLGAGLMGPGGGWVGGQDILVQTGDVVDRGHQSSEIYETLFRLQDEAPQSGGEVILLLGNHELMNMDGDFRYSSNQETECLGGSLGRAAAFGPAGWPGRELRRRGKAVARFGEAHGFSQPVLFAHAGVLPSVAHAFDQRPKGLATASSEQATTGQQAADALNAAVKGYLAGNQSSHDRSLEVEHSALFGHEGPFWTRHHATSPDLGAVCGELEQTLGVFGAARMVVGHTSQDDGLVKHRCSGRLILADTGISEAISGTAHPSAVEISDSGEAFAIYPPAAEDASAGSDAWQKFIRESLPTVELMPVDSNGTFGLSSGMRWRLAVLGLECSEVCSEGGLPALSGVRRAYRRLSLQRHPDKGGSQAEFRELQLAYDGVVRELGAAA